MDAVIFRMGSDELHEHSTEPVRHVHDQPVLVPPEVENRAVVADEIDATAKLPLEEAAPRA
jgi:hypothetical protein